MASSLEDTPLRHVALTPIRECHRKEGEKEEVDVWMDRWMG
jgi:hypothetical protein